LTLNSSYINPRRFSFQLPLCSFRGDLNDARVLSRPPSCPGQLCLPLPVLRIARRLLVGPPAQQPQPDDNLQTDNRMRQLDEQPPSPPSPSDLAPIPRMRIGASEATVQGRARTRADGDAYSFASASFTPPGSQHRSSKS
jgi:hypothetical protein